MSTVVVTTRTIAEIKPHPNADRLELAVVGGWQTVVPKGEGVVVRPLRERHDPKTGRVILKYVSDEYLCGEYDAASE
jgi:hypothetical protein